ncbi:MAG TPA: SprT-like domain-containing protein [Chitinophagaceae bacterium]|nr:SprT-like domain-containing protein [Chitinophagaceae bacterium]
MAKQEAPLQLLKNYLPEGSYEAVVRHILEHRVHLTITRQRRSVLGDYRHRTHYANHRISINSNLNRYAFLITLLHELAHLFTYEQFGNGVSAHGREWKAIYAGLLKEFINSRIFPPDIERELFLSLRNPAASSCAEDGLIRVLRNYDPAPNGHRLVEELPENALFRSEGRVFRKLEKLRKRFRCIEVATGHVYLFSPVYEVEELNA